jgi:hypothetical protein
MVPDEWNQLLVDCLVMVPLALYNFVLAVDSLILDAEFPCLVV